MCDCHCSLVASHSTACSVDHIPGQPGILFQGGADWLEGHRDRAAQETRQGVKVPLGTTVTAHISTKERTESFK